MFFRKKRDAISILAIILIVVLAVVVVVAVVLPGLWQPSDQVVGSGNLATEARVRRDFTIVEVGSGFQVEITQSSSYSINVTADDNLFDYVTVSKTGNTLKIHLKSDRIYRSVTLRAEITMPDLYELKFSEGTCGTVEGFNSSREFVVELSEGSHLSGNITTSGDAQFTLSEGSQMIELHGAAKDLHISASEGSNSYLSDFPVHNTSVTLSGGSHATINLDGRLDADLEGGSHLYYIGDPTMGDIQTSGGSTVEKEILP